MITINAKARVSDKGRSKRETGLASPRNTNREPTWKAVVGAVFRDRTRPGVTANRLRVSRWQNNGGVREGRGHGAPATIPRSKAIGGVAVYQHCEMKGLSPTHDSPLREPDKAPAHLFPRVE